MTTHDLRVTPNLGSTELKTRGPFAYRTLLGHGHAVDMEHVSDTSRGMSYIFIIFLKQDTCGTWKRHNGAQFEILKNIFGGRSEKIINLGNK